MKLKRFVAELTLGCSDFEYNEKNRKVYRCRTRSELIGFKRKDLKNAKMRLVELEKECGGTLIESYLYQEV